VISLTTIATLFVDGFAYGMVLFLIAIGLTVTLGVMRVVNLAHCAFAMVGGYGALALIQAGLDYFAALALAVAGTMLFGILLERSFFKAIYRTSELDQLLITIGLTFVLIAGCNAVFGPDLFSLPLPRFLQGTYEGWGFVLSRYRAFLVAVSGMVAAGMWWGLEFTSFGAKLRAAVDNPRMARCVAIKVSQIFTLTFAGGCGLAALGGILGAAMLPLEPWYGLKYLVLTLMVVAVGGLGSIKGSLVAALLLGLVDTFGRYYVPAAGAFVIYVLTGALLLWRPNGLFGRAADERAATARAHVVQPYGAFDPPRWHALDVLPWLLIVAVWFTGDSYLPLATQVMIMIIFALSLDLALGYGGIETLGHAAFFGVGGYAAAIFARHVSADPIMDLGVAAAMAAAIGVVSGIVILRVRGLTQVMLTLAAATILAELANSWRSLTGGDDGLKYPSRPIFGQFAFDLTGRTAFWYAAVVLAIVFVAARIVVHAPFGLTIRAIRDNALRARTLGVPVTQRLVLLYAIAGAIAGIAGAVSAQATKLVALDSLGFILSGNILIMLVVGGTSRLYGAFLGPLVIVVLSDWAAEIAPVHWVFALGLTVMATVRYAPGGLLGAGERLWAAVWKRR
jgi:branched-chain amino acid transport system permease protein